MKLSTKTTFDRSVIKTNWRRINESPLKKAGLYIRKVAIRSIRRDRSKAKTASTAGKPPKTRAAGDPLRRIYSVPVQFDTQVIVGPVGFDESPPAPEVHEKGLRARRSVLPRWYLRLKGKARAKRKRPRPTIRSVQYPPRPFMVPAMEKSKPRLPPLWRGSLSS